MILVTSHLKGILDHLRLHKALFRKAPLQPIRRHGRATVSLHRNDTIQHLQSNTEPAQPSCWHSGVVGGQGGRYSEADLFVFVDYQGGKGLVRVLGIGVMRFDGAEFDFPVPIRELFQDPVQHRALRDVVLVEVDEAVDVLGGVGHFFDVVLCRDMAEATKLVSLHLRFHLRQSGGRQARDGQASWVGV